MSSLYPFISCQLNLFLQPTLYAIPISYSHTNFLHKPSKPSSNHFYLSIKKSGFCCFTHSSFPTPVNLEEERKERGVVDLTKLVDLKQNLEKHGIHCGDTSTLKRGEYNRLMCPKCGGGDSFEKSLSLFLRPSGDLAMWQCFRDKCAWRGHVEAIEAERTSYGQFNYTAKVEPSKSITKASMGLEPPCQKALSMPSAFMSQDQEHQEIDMLDSTGLISLKQKLEKHGIHCATCKPGEYNHLICPECGGGDSLEKSFSLFINPVGDLAMWQCFREECGRRGHVRSALYDQFECTPDVEPIRYITEESIGLEPLCEELIAYFSKRMITRETLRRNAVMQKAGKQLTIAFTYRRNGVLTSCKYRQINKRFRQERGTEKILYGLDDIKQAIDIIIVEGEMDKLSMEEAGFCNCVSVPDGAPTKVSTKDLLCAEQDTGFQYLWNCKEYFEKASRIILATDADPPGQVLAEELARRLGRERCWRVKWPKKNEVDVCKDANEVLMYLGHHALRTMIDEAKSYPTV